MHLSIFFATAFVCLMSCIIEQVYTTELEISLLESMDASYVKHATELQTAQDVQAFEHRQKQLNKELDLKIDAYLKKKFGVEELPVDHSALVFDIRQIHATNRLISLLQNPTHLRHAQRDAPEVQISKIVERFIQGKQVKEETQNAKGEDPAKSDK